MTSHGISIEPKTIMDHDNIIQCFYCVMLACLERIAIYVTTKHVPPAIVNITTEYTSHDAGNELSASNEDAIHSD